MKSFALFLALLALPLAARADKVDLGPHGTFTITPPSGWTVSTKSKGDQGTAITLTPPGDANAACLINVSIVPVTEPVTREKVQEQTLAICDQFVDASVEKKKILREFAMAQSFGYYCVFTDASMVGQPAKKGEFKVIGVGVVRLRDDVMAAVGISADDEKSPEFAAMLAAVASAAVAPATHGG
jgi:hypothetical protein